MSKLSFDALGNPVHVFNPGASQNVTTSGTSAQSAALGGNTLIVRLIATTDCRVAFGANPTATATSMLLTAGVPEFFTVQVGSKIAAIATGLGGALNITEMA